MKPVIIYCYDAWCNWCYAFSPVMQRLEAAFVQKADFEVLSGGMILPETPKPIALMADFFRENCQTVTAHTGIEFGENYLWHINHPDWSDWFPNSEKSAIALCVFKEYHPNSQVTIADELLYALQNEGRDLCDEEAYRHLLELYKIPAEEFYALLKDPIYKEKAYHEFALCRQLQVTGFPAVLMQVSDTKIITISSGYLTYDVLQQKIESVMKEYNL